MTYRRLLIGLAVAFAALITAVVLIDTDGDPATMPEPLQSVFPLPNDVVARQTGIEVDLPIGYELTLSIDGIHIPPDEITVLEGVGRHRWRPAPGRTIEQWEPGSHLIEITWDRVAGGRPDPGGFSWTFRVT